jgi:DNA topoisomerase VI subunit B
VNDVPREGAGPAGPTVAPPALHFQQAKNPSPESNFLQIVAKPKQAARSKPEAKPEPKLTRVAFRVSRLMEFCSQRELISQTGHSAWEWPLVVVKELFDNALDACEEAEIAPALAIDVEKDAIVVQDNAGGLDAETIESVLDYTIRVSSREAYVSPTRGAQGNALKTILAMGFVLHKEVDGGDPVGVTAIESRGIRHRIEFRVDHINSQPKIVRRTSASPIEAGTKITVRWPPRAAKMLLDHTAAQFKQLVRAYTWFNPHLSVRGTWLGREFINTGATNPTWEKWRPSHPTSARWYDEARLARYLAAHVSRDRDLGQRRTVREFVGEFRGLSGTAIQRKVLNEVGCSHQSLAQFFGVKRVNSEGVAKLLVAMRRYSKPVPPRLLGVIGEDHFKVRFLEAGGNADTFSYQKRTDVAEGVPYVIEVAFGLHEAALTPGPVDVPRVFVTGANWSRAISNPFRSFGRTGEGAENALAQARADSKQPVIFALHLASARLQFADRGKSSIVLTGAAGETDV